MNFRYQLSLGRRVTALLCSFGHLAADSLVAQGPDEVKKCMSFHQPFSSTVLARRVRWW